MNSEEIQKKISDSQDDQMEDDLKTPIVEEMAFPGQKAVRFSQRALLFRIINLFSI